MILRYVFKRILLMLLFIAGGNFLQAQILMQFIPIASGQSMLSELSYIQNSALFTNLDSSVLAVGYIPSRFGLTELATSELLFGRRLTNELVIATHISGLGNELYSEISGTLHASFKTTDALTFGGAVQLSRISFKNERADFAVQFHAGTLLQLSDKLTAGASLQNFTRAYYAGGEQTVQQQANFSIGIEALDNLFFDAGAKILLNKSSGISLAASYKRFKNFHFSLAALSNPRSAEFSFAIPNIYNFTISGTAHYHDLLGFSERISIAYYF
ncbi:MAG TPA: hypothetical protein VEC36_09765 [Patescibacteria group bacterium]|nr:hypothetical protein [Patescibacteria group bacterium]